MQGELTFLGTGTSMGVPTLGCRCAVCTSADPRDRRLRPSILLRWEETQSDPNEPARERVVLIDTGPDFREQALRTGLTRVDAVLYTHGHVDHVFGLDDLRPLSFTVFREGSPIALYASEETSEVLTRVFDYTFSPDSTYPNRARVELNPLQAVNTVFGVDFLRVPICHGRLGIVGYRFGKVAYLTDVSEIPEESFALLEGLDHLILSALRHKPHHNHLTLAQARVLAERIQARQTWFTHIAHELGHAETSRSLPPQMQMAWDGLSFPVELGREI